MQENRQDRSTDARATAWRTRTMPRIAPVLACTALVLLASCASTNDAPAVDLDAPIAVQLAGQWESELDGAILILEPTGIFSVERPARGATPAATVVGRWTLEEGSADGREADAAATDDDATESGIIVFENLRGSAACSGVRGVYAAEVVRDTVRFTKRADDCPSREEHMAWPWRKPKPE